MDTRRITHQTRDASFQAILPFVEGIKERVFEAVRRHHPAGLTAEDAAEEAKCSLNSARSRLTELFLVQRVVVIGKRANKLGTRKIAAWALPGILG